MAPEWFVCGLLSGRWKKIEVSEGWGGLGSPDSTRVPRHQRQLLLIPTSSVETGELSPRQATMP